MKKISRLLMSIYVLLIALALFIVALYESGVLTPGALAHSKQSEFVAVAIMEIVSLLSVYLGLRMFHFTRIYYELVFSREPALLKWGILRLLMLEVPMVVNTYLYYIYMNTTFGYLAIILLLTLPFVFPSLSRCVAEITDKE